ncbi:hypothetical protein EN833_23370 [Mesorhizobium sp. M4B.F.Ca.ET.190.01.1.1]|nr:hypothetical protein EN843_23360 [Mesorhizobium sp. M4B.F.Ca.ET.200.01.1.1]TGS15751.1 hypothetical protein EN833_23370 [Mesorhizobium sp. M4B.F.Ca.ET.190.01.1.1]TGT27811.1 hypothetical protein EN815_23345 [Mesorhizobium sp. M4B.F.Ca.ET.172.01.1.1]
MTHGKFAPQAKWRDKNPLATWAHSAKLSALRKGILVKQPCAVCGNEQVDFHHDPDHYDQPLRGTWLCRRHHVAEHRRLRCEAANG